MRPKPKAPLNERQRELWSALNDFIRENDGVVVSQPGVSVIRFECRRESGVPELLRGLGYEVVSAGTSECLMPITEVLTEQATNTKVTRQHVGPVEVAIFEFKLPFG
jgi:hypothetical protein